MYIEIILQQMDEIELQNGPEKVDHLKYQVLCKESLHSGVKVSKHLKHDRL